MLEGIDVSHHNGTVNWAQVKQAGKVFALAKATEGTGFVDSRFAANWSAMKNAGLVRGAYHYFRVFDDAVAQADSFLNHVHLEAGDLPAAVDIEGTFNKGATNAQWITGLHTWLDRVQGATGRKPIIYTRANFFNKHLDASFGGNPLWVAHFGVLKPTLPIGWDAGGFTFWQFAENGQVSGISGAVDTDHFNGDEQALHSLTI